MAHAMDFLEQNGWEALFGCPDCDRRMIAKLDDAGTVTGTVMLAVGEEVSHANADLASQVAGLTQSQKNRRASAAELKQLDGPWQARGRKPGA